MDLQIENALSKFTSLSLLSQEYYRFRNYFSALKSQIAESVSDFSVKELDFSCADAILYENA